MRRFAPVAGGLVVGAAVAAVFFWRPTPEQASIRPVSTFAGSHSQPSFAPDGKRFAFINDADGVSHVWILAAGEEPPRQITSGATSDSRPRWSPDGNSILFMRNDSVWSVTPSGNEPAEILREASNPNWSRTEGKSYSNAATKCGPLTRMEGTRHAYPVYRDENSR